MWTKNPSKRQIQVLVFIKDFQNKHSYSPSLAEIAEHFSVSIPTIHQHVQALKKKGLISAKKGKKRSIEAYSKPKKDVVEIPLMGIIPAGGPIEPIRNPEPLEVLSSILSRSGRHYALKVSGTSMVEDGILDGDIVVVREQPVVENGESAVAYIPDKNEVTLKKIYREKNRIRLQPANKDMEPSYEKNVQIQGRVIGVIRKIK